MQLKYMNHMKTELLRKYDAVVDFVVVGSENTKSRNLLLASGLNEKYYYEWDQGGTGPILDIITRKHNYAWAAAFAAYPETDLLISCGSSDLIPPQYFYKLVEHELDNSRSEPRIYGISPMCVPGTYAIEVDNTFTECYVMSDATLFQSDIFLGGVLGFNKGLFDRVGKSITFDDGASEGALVQKLRRHVPDVNCMCCCNWFINFKVSGCDFTTFEWIARTFNLVRYEYGTRPALDDFQMLLSAFAAPDLEANVGAHVPFVNLKLIMERHKDELEPRLMSVLYDSTDYVLGHEVTCFERAFASYIGTDHCTAVGNGTDAIEIAIDALGLPDCSEIITQANTYVATAFAITNSGHELKLVDVDPITLQMDLDHLESCITSNTKAVVVVHMYGGCCNMRRLSAIASSHNLRLIEDCAQAHGSTYDGKRLGSFGSLSTFSFYPTKNLGAAGDGGAICCSDPSQAVAVRQRHNQGGLVKYQHTIVGRNSRLDSIQACVLNVKLPWLDVDNQERRSHAELYGRLLRSCKHVTIPEITSRCLPVYHIYVIQAKDRDALLSYLTSHRIGVGVHYAQPIHKLDAYAGSLEGADLRVSERMSNELISLPMHVGLSSASIRYVCDHISKYYSEDSNASMEQDE